MACSPATAWSDGSSPRPWGTPETSIQHKRCRRFIPTPVGNASMTTIANVLRSVHPHARGDRQHWHAQTEDEVGSSPRPWGTPVGDGLGAVAGRFIPTPVGNASSWRRPATAPSVHPHARGERYTALGGADQTAGSSPRPWGTPGMKAGSQAQRRFIPTPVGNADWRGSTPSASPVHPHARGERLLAAAKGAFRAGSSPRPWGTRARRLRRLGLQRFIPTPVGNARSLAPSSLAMSGSSPRPWGTPDAHQGAEPRRRFIPTPVGNAATITRRVLPVAVHPHARGERKEPSCCTARMVGSSPRPWGTRRPRRLRRLRATGSSPRPWGTRDVHAVVQRGVRFIPTPVGNAQQGQRHPA